MSVKGQTYIVGIYEHPTRKIDDKSRARFHAEVANGVLEDADLTQADVDGYFCAGNAPGLGAPSMDYCFPSCTRSPTPSHATCTAYACRS
jgi:acetyl-CoA C-acetyltransferase